MVWSSGVTPAAVTRTSTLPSAPRGLCTSTSFRPPYPVKDSARMALITFAPSAALSSCMVGVRSVWISVRDARTLSQAAAERDVLARRLVDHDHQIIWRDFGGRDHAVVQGLQQSQSLLLGTAGDERDLQQDQVIRIVEPQERRRVKEPATGQNANDLEEVVGRNAQCAYERVLNRAGHPAETSLVVPSFEHMDLGEGHV